MTPKDPIDLVRDDLRELRSIIRSELKAIKEDIEQLNIDMAVHKSEEREKKRLGAIWTPAIVSAIVASLLAFFKH